jgi:hypothetical protein
MVKIDRFGCDSANFPLAVAMLGPSGTYSRGMRANWGGGVDHFPYLQEKLSRRYGFQQQMKFMTPSAGVFY